MPAPLDLEIARRLGTDPEATAEALRTVIDRVRQQVGLYGYARLAGIGTFRQQNGNLTFEPDRGLAEAVNHRFAGLEPVLIDAPASEPDVAPAPHEDVVVPSPPVVAFGAPDSAADEPEPALTAERGDIDEHIAVPGSEREEEELWVEGAEAIEPHPLGPGGPDFEEADFTYVPEDAPDRVGATPAPTVVFRDPDEPFEDEAAPAPIERDEPLPAAAAAPTIQWNEPAEPEAPVAGPAAEAAPSEEPSAPAEPPVVSPPPPRAAPEVTAGKHRVQRGPNRVAQEQDARSSAPWIAGVLLGVIALAVVAWLFLRDTSPGAADDLIVGADTAAVAAPVDTSTLAAGTTADTAGTTAGTEPLPTETVPPDDTTPEVAPPADASPLRSTAGIDLEAGGYTIVVGSEASQQAAERHAARYREQGFRTGIVEGRTGDGRTRYRVGVGQFQESADAAAAIAELREAGVPADAWVLRIR